MIWKILDLVFDTLERLFEILDRVFDDRVNRAVAVIFLLSFSYIIIFKGFEGVDKFVMGYVFAWSFNKLFSSSGDEEPRRKIPWRRRAS